MSRQIGPYVIVEELGRGGMGIVFKAREEALQRFVAIKMLGNQLADNDSVVQRFMREARAVADVNHPNLVQVFRVDKHEGQPYFVMEYVQGESLKALIQRERRMQPARALQVLKEVAAGLGAAHEKGVVHRDIKPENIMLTRFGGVKVVDFGIARVDEPGTRLTTTGIGLGTPSYLSPEVCLSQDVDARSDLFSLGVVLFEMLTGDIPFKSDSPFELMTKVVEAKVPDIKALNPNVDDGVKQILAKLIAKRPKRRYQNCNELISDIEDYKAGRVPRWAKDTPLDTAEPAEIAADEQESGDAAAATEAQTTPMPSGAASQRQVAATEAVAGGGSVGTEAVPAGAARRPRRRGWIAVVLALVLVAGGAGATWVWLAGDAGPWRTWFAQPGAESVVADIDDEDSDRPGADDDRRDVDVAAAATDSAATGPDALTDDSSLPAETAAPTGPAIAGAGDAGAGAQDAGAQAEASGAGFEFVSVNEPAPAGASDRSAGSARSETPPAAASEAPAAATGSDAAVVPASDAVLADAAAASAAESSGADARVATANPGGPAAAVEGMPDSPRVAVIAVGDPAVAGPLARVIKHSLDGASFEVVDEQLLDGLVYAESLAGIARTARDGGIDVLVYADVVPTGERELQFYGRSELQQLATLEVRVVDLREQRNLGRPVVREIEYVALTAGREAREIARPVARNVVNRLRALRAMSGQARPG